MSIQAIKASSQTREVTDLMVHGSEQGLTLCGAALCTLVSAAAQQLFTAALARVVLGRRLTSAQHASVCLDPLCL